MTSKNKRPKSALPLAFTEHGVVMLSSVLRSDIAVQTSVLITRAFVAMRQMIANSPVIMSAQLQKEMKELKEYIEDVFADQNDINEDTRMQIELINQVLAELQVHKKFDVSVISWLSVLYALNDRKVTVWILCRYKKVKI